jgi:hypothetical protein
MTGTTKVCSSEIVNEMRTRRVSGKGMMSLAAIITLTSSALCAGEVKVFKMNGVTLGLDGATGGIVLLRHEGSTFLRDDGAGALVDMAYPVTEFIPLRISSRYSVARISEANGVIEIRYDQLASSRPKLGYPHGRVSAVVAISKCDDGRSLSLKCRVENNSEASIGQVFFPDLDGLRPVGSREETRLKMARGEVLPFLRQRKPEGSAPFYAQSSAWQHYPACSFSQGPNCLRWLDYGDLSAGFSLFQKKWREGERPDIWANLSETQEDCLRLCWDHKLNNGAIKPGQVWESGEFVLTCHRGGWAKGITPFREYVRQVNPKPLYELPEHIRTGLGYRSAWMMEHLETDPSRAYFRFADIGRLAEEAKRHGLNEVVIWGWTDGFFKLPFRSDPNLGTEEEFISGIKRAKAIGVNVAPFVSCQLIHRDYLARYGKTRVTRSQYTYHGDLVPTLNPTYAQPFACGGAVIEPANEQWRKDVEDSFRYWLDRGVASFCWDVFGGHDVTDRTAMLDLASKLRGMARSIDPQSSFSAETVSRTGFEWDGQLVDYTWNWVTAYADCGPILSVLKTPRPNCIVEDSPLTAMQAFADGMYLNIFPRKPGQANGSALIAECPELSRKLVTLAGRRQQFRNYFTGGSLVGESVLGAPSRLFVRGHLLGDRMLVIVINPKKESISESLSLALHRWLTGGKYTLTMFNAAGAVLRRKGITVADKEYIARASLGPVDMMFVTAEPRQDKSHKEAAAD